MAVTGTSGTIRCTAPWVLALACVWPAGALGQATQPSRTAIEQSEWRRCEALEAKNEHAQAGLCWARLVDKYPTDRQVPWLLHSTGVDFTRAKHIGDAMRARQALVTWAEDECRKGSPTACNHPLAKKALFQLGQNAMDLAMFDSAARYFETFASKHGADKEAVQALSTAVFIRRGLGQDGKAAEDARDFIKLYGRARPQEAAAVAFAIGQIFETQESWDKVAKHYTEYLRDWGPRGGVDREIVAHVKIGAVQWRQSCPVGGVSGACVEITLAAAGGARSLVKTAAAKAARFKRHTWCGPERKSRLTIHARRPALAKAAQEHFATALRLYRASHGKASHGRAGGRDPQDRAVREAEMLHAVAQAKFLQVEADYEKFLALQIPNGLEFNADPTRKLKNDESTRRFAGYVEAKSKTIDKLKSDYAGVIAFRQPPWAIAALARTGQLYQSFADQLTTSEIPKAPKAPPGIKQDEFQEMFAGAYCDQLGDQVEKWKLVPKAVEAFTRCVDRSTALDWHDEWSTLCQEEFDQLAGPCQPSGVEIRPQPGHVKASIEAAKAVFGVKE